MSRRSSREVGGVYEDQGLIIVRSFNLSNSSLAAHLSWLNEVVENECRLQRYVVVSDLDETR